MYASKVRPRIPGVASGLDSAPVARSTGEISDWSGISCWKLAAWPLEMRSRLQLRLRRSKSSIAIDKNLTEAGAFPGARFAFVGYSLTREEIGRCEVIGSSFEAESRDPCWESSLSLFKCPFSIWHYGWGFLPASYSYKSCCLAPQLGTCLLLDLRLTPPNNTM